MNTRTLVFLISCVVLVAWAILFSDYSIDDAFITFRYAENLADGYGLVFNPGDAPVEGYSNTLWLFLLAFLYKLGCVTYPTAKFVGLITSAVAGAMLFLYFRNDRQPLLWLAGPLFLAAPPLAFWSLSGLELGLHTLILVLAFIAMLRRSRWAIAFLALLVLSRPEGAPIGLVMIGAMALSDFFNKQLKISYYLVAALAVLATLAALTLFRLEVFGYPFPNTYYAKTGQSLYGFDRLLDFLLRFAPLTLAALWGLVFVIKSRARDRLLTACLAVFIAQAAISASVDPVMNLLYRYLTPVLPLFLLAGLIMIEKLKSSKAQYGFIGLVFLLSATSVVRARELQDWNRQVVSSQNKVIAWAYHLPSLTTISMTDMGRVPYYTRKNFNDLWGLVDRNIAHGGYNPVSEFLHLPDYFILVGHLEGDQVKLKFWREQILTVGTHFSRCYEPVQILGPDLSMSMEPEYNYLIYRRRPSAKSIVESYGTDYWKSLLNTGPEKRQAGE